MQLLGTHFPFPHLILGHFLALAALLGQVSQQLCELGKMQMERRFVPRKPKLDLKVGNARRRGERASDPPAGT